MPRRPGDPPLAYLNDDTDFPDDMMSEEERRAIEADERRREAGFDPRPDGPSHVEHARVRKSKRRRPTRPEDNDVYPPFYDGLSADAWSGDDEDTAAPAPTDDEVREVWLRAQRMTQTELLLRLGLHLIASDDICGHVTVALRGREVSRRDAPKFPLTLFLHDRGARRVDAPTLSDDWRGEYALRGRRYHLCLSSDHTKADLEVEVGAGDRFLVFGAAGMLEATRSPAEDRAVNEVIGRALRHRDVNPRDLVAVAVPRSGAFRRIASSLEAAPRVVSIGLTMLLVDRVGSVSGLPFLKSFENQ
jgi:hypothetical protein